MRKFFVVLVWVMGLGQPATNMFEDWSENITETDLLHEEKDKGFSPKKNPKKLMKEMDQIVQDDIKNIH